MGLRFSCPRCQKHFKVAEAAAGKKTHCTRCGEYFRIPAAMATVAAGRSLPEMSDSSPLPTYRNGNGNGVFPTSVDFDPHPPHFEPAPGKNRVVFAMAAVATCIIAVVAAFWLLSSGSPSPSEPLVAAATAPAAKPNKPSEPPAAFDPRDIERSARWIKQQWSKEEPQKAVAKVGPVMSEQVVQWRVTVVQVLPLEGWKRPRAVIKTPPGIHLRFSTPEGGRLSYEELWQDHHLHSKEIRKLVPGTVLIVQGRIGEIEGDMNGVRLVLFTVRVQPDAQ